jgi:hypothetical protein
MLFLAAYLLTQKLRELAPTNLKITKDIYYKIQKHAVMSDKGQSRSKNILFTVPLTVEG